MNIDLNDKSYLAKSIERPNLTIEEDEDWDGSLYIRKRFWDPIKIVFSKENGLFYDEWLTRGLDKAIDFTLVLSESEKFKIFDALIISRVPNTEDIELIINYGHAEKI